MAVETNERPVLVERPPRLRRVDLRGIEQEELGRRTLPAGSAIIVGLLALALGSLLNAESIRRTAEMQSEGWKRDVGLALTRPLVAVSRGLGLAEPRRELRRALGRPSEGGNVVVTFSHSRRPTRTHRAAAPPQRKHKAVQPAKVAFSPKKRLRLWVAGDSLSITPGWAIVRIGDRSHVVKRVGLVDGRVATGLERPDVFDWFDHARSEVAKLHPNAVVLTFGANDDHSLMTGTPRGIHVGDFGSRSWVREYRRRVGGLMDDVTARGAFLVWVGLPITRDAGERGRFRLLNRIYRSEAEKRRGRVAFVDTYDLFESDGGGYTDYLQNDKGDLVRVRADDGVHFQPAGGDMIAWQVMKALRDHFDLTSWRKRQAG
jgi:hypothetical protein